MHAKLLKAAERRNVPLYTGFECTAIPEKGMGSLEASGHYDKFREDIRLVKERLGTDMVRGPVPWYRIEKEKGQYDWRWMDAYIDACRKRGVTLIADLCHHASVPLWTNFAEPSFPTAFTTFVDKFSDRYPDVTWYTLVNEPTATAALCTGPWYPRHPDYYKMIRHMGQAIGRATQLLQQKHPLSKFFHTDPAEHKQTRDAKYQSKVDEFNNHDRFINFDLFLGLINPHHPRYMFLRGHGFTEEELAWFTTHPAKIHVMALDYYLHVEQIEGDEGNVGPLPARGIARLLLDYVQRYANQFPDIQFALGEMNVRGSSTERLAWLTYGLRESEILQRLLRKRFFGSCWYPAVDSMGWGNGSLMTALTGDPEKDLDPTGIIPVDPYTLERKPDEEMPILFGKYARKEITVRSLPSYSFSETMHNYPVPRLGHRLKGVRKRSSQNKISSDEGA